MHNRIPRPLPHLPLPLIKNPIHKRRHHTPHQQRRHLHITHPKLPPLPPIPQLLINARTRRTVQERKPRPGPYNTGVHAIIFPELSHPFVMFVDRGVHDFYGWERRATFPDLREGHGDEVGDCYCAVGEGNVVYYG